MRTVRNRKSYKNSSKRNKKSLTRKLQKKKHSKKYHLKGGNFGGHCPDPNFSIYNTNMLKLFPYSTFGKVQPNQ
uniref:Uncharacterized protein n=1 Tax=viral metagenome TaxID=1070528 RepID=A0A6C0JH22_9ZZZZ